VCNCSPTGLWFIKTPNSIREPSYCELWFNRLYSYQSFNRAQTNFTISANVFFLPLNTTFHDQPTNSLSKYLLFNLIATLSQHITSPPKIITSPLAEFDCYLISTHSLSTENHYFTQAEIDCYLISTHSLSIKNHQLHKLNLIATSSQYTASPPKTLPSSRPNLEQNLQELIT